MASGNKQDALPCSHDLGQYLGIVMVRLVELHLKSGRRMPCIEAFDIKAAHAAHAQAKVSLVPSLARCAHPHPH